MHHRAAVGAPNKFRIQLIFLEIITRFVGAFKDALPLLAGPQIAIKDVDFPPSASIARWH